MGVSPSTILLACGKSEVSKPSLKSPNASRISPEVWRPCESLPAVGGRMPRIQPRKLQRLGSLASGGIESMLQRRLHRLGDACFRTKARARPPPQFG